MSSRHVWATRPPPWRPTPPASAEPGAPPNDKAPIWESRPEPEVANDISTSDYVIPQPQYSAAEGLYRFVPAANIRVTDRLGMCTCGPYP
eukprot:364261-Chlamydomonas_euryale.AAC.11